MPITTKHTSEVTTSGVTGFGGSVGTPANFANPDDANLFSQITANMDSGPSNSRAFNRIALTGLNDWIPTSTITRRRIVVKYRQTLTSIGDAPATAHFKAGYMYSLNNGGAWTTVEVDQTGPNLNFDSGILEDFITLPGGQDLTQILVEAYAEVTKVGAGGTASASHADLQGFHAYVETYEDLVDLLIVRANGEGTSLVGTGDIHQEITNPTNAYDNNLSTFSHNQMENHYTVLEETQHNLIVRHDFPLTAVPTRIIDAVIRFKWEAEGFMSRAAGSLAVATNTVKTAHSSDGGSSYTYGAGNKFTITQTNPSFDSGGPFSVTKTLELVYYRMASPNKATTQFKLLSEHITSCGPLFIGADYTLRSTSKFYEIWLELRIESSQESGGGWFDV